MKSFFKPTLGKIVLSLVLLGLVGVVGFLCQPIYADFTGTIQACGNIGSVFFIPLLLAVTYPILWLIYLIFSYIIASLIILLLNRFRKKK